MAVKHLKSKTKAFFEKAFPERQIYHRSGGSVRYVSISPWRQAMMAGGATLIVGWCLFATVAVLLRGPSIDIQGGSSDRKTARLERELRQSETLWGVPGPAVPAVALDSTPGDVVVFNHALKHAAFGGSRRRRMFTMNCCGHYPAAQLHHLRAYIGNHAYYLVDRLHHDLLVQTAGPERLVHLAQGLANDGHLAELSARRRAELAAPPRS